MSAPEQRTVRVRRRPRIGVFLIVGVVVGGIAAVIGALVGPSDPAFPTAQALGFLLLVFAPLGAGLGALVAIVLDALGARGARTAQAERDPAGFAPPGPEPEAPVEEL